MRIYYQSGTGNNRINLDSKPYWMQTGDFLDYVWEYTAKNSRLEFKKTVKERHFLITVFGDTEEKYYANLNKLHEIFEKDLTNNTPGKLYFNEYYLKCYVYASAKTEWEYGCDSMDNDLKIVTERPSWISEQTISVPPITTSVAAEGTVKGYPYGYPYGYARLETATTMTIDHYAESDFRLTAYGPAANVYVNIAGHPYSVDYPLEAGEYMVIDSRDFLKADERIYVVRANGERVNVFNYRDPIYSVFKKIPPGKITIDYSRAYGIDLIIFKERSEPKWS